MKKIFTFLIFLVFINASFGQISHGGEPYSFNHTDLKSNIDYRILPEVDVEQLLFEDAMDENDPDIPWRFGKDIAVDYNLENSGTWEELPNGDRIWRLEIISYGAYSINLIYSKYHMPIGGSLFVYNKQKTHTAGSFTNENHKPNGGFATIPIKGESCILEYYEPAEFFGQGELEVSFVIHAYKDFYHNPEKGFGSSGACNVNANCPEGDEWQDQKRGVAMILTANNARKCSGSMINNTAEDGTPYFLTANHCKGGESSWIIMFNYESPGCEDVDGPTNQSIQYTTLRASSFISDFCLVELSEIPPLDYNVYYNGWNRLDESSDHSVCIHHPKGDIKKISFDNDTYTSDKYLGTSGLEGSHWKITQWDLGTTEGGSSGSPLFNPQKQIVGQLHGGWASCTALEPDWYGKFSMSWDYGSQVSDRLLDWLDPLDLGLESIGGFDPVANEFAYNAALVSVIQPESQYNGPLNIQPEILIRNMGNQALESLNVSYQLNEGEVVSQSWSGNLDIYDTAHVIFPAIELNYGVHEILAFVDSPSGQVDEYPENDTIRKTISVDLDYDIAIEEFISPIDVNCSSDTLKTRFIIKNVGFQAVTGINAYLKLDENVPVLHELEGNIAPGASQYYVLDAVGVDGEWHTLTLEVDIDGQEDQNPSNNIYVGNFNSFGNDIQLIINTDDKGEETYWVLKDEEDNLVASGDDYGNNESIKTAYCLSQGCYLFTIYDRGGDGIDNEMGFSLLNSNTDLELGNGSDFGDSLNVYFCISNVLTSDFTLINDTTCTNRDVFYINQSSGADYYSWYFEGGMPIASNEANPVVQYPNPGVYDVALRSWQGEESIENLKEDYITVITCAGIEKVENDLFTLFPNPSSGQFKISLKTNHLFDQILMYDPLGALIWSSEIIDSDESFDVNVPSGLYIIELQSENLSQKRLLLINK